MKKQLVRPATSISPKVTIFGLILAIGTAVVSVTQDHFDWKLALVAAIGAVGAYLKRDSI